ncbi:MAG TPA: glycosyltransferase family 39 protein [Planctomycetota bacterium]|nr:glycosyltransferase family 39 protein [Planctomycetota bacterium]
MVDGALSGTVNERLSKRERWLALALFAIALLLRLWIVAVYEAHHPQASTPVIDEAAYDSWARRIAAGDWVGEGVFFQEPLYSYLLGVLYWITGPSLHAARLVQAAIGATTAIAVLFLARRLFGRAAGWIAGLGWAVYRPALWFPTLLLKENVFTLVLVLLAIAILRTRDSRRPWLEWSLVGILAGIGALLRGNLLVMIPILALWPLARAALQKQRMTSAISGALSVAVCAALVLLPVALRNQSVGRAFVLTTSGAGTNIYGGNNLDNPHGVATEFAWVRGVPEHEADDWRHEAERRSGRTLTPVEVSSFWMHASLDSMREHPLEHAKILGSKLILTLGAYEVPDNHFLEWDARYVAPLRWPWPGFGVIGPLALLGALLFLIARSKAAALGADIGAAREVLLLAALYLGTVVLTVTSDRIRLPLVPLLLPFAAFTVHGVWLWMRDRLRVRPWQHAGIVALAAILTCIVQLPLIDAAERANDLDERDFNLAAALLRNSGSKFEAEAIVGRLAALHPNSVRVDLLESQLDFDRGCELAAAGAEGLKAAEARFGIALERLKLARSHANPQELFRVHFLAGVIQQFMGQWAAAARHYAAALEFDSEDPDLLRRRGVCLANAAMKLPPGEERMQGLDQALAVLDALAAKAPDSEVIRLIAEIRAAR